MPTYEYACGACGHQWEAVQRITEAPLEQCPACAQKAAHRLISRGTNFILKGGGWYSDLYASPKEPAKEKVESAAPVPAQETKADAKTESKSESKTATAPADAAPPPRPTPPAASS
jgi:putative FmdB family regulatory protein